MVPFIHHIQTFVEPCGGDGRLVHHLTRLGKHCVRFFDIAPDSVFVAYGDAFTADYTGVEAIITNPPWSRPILHAMIIHFVESVPECWLLFDSNWVNTAQSVPYMKWCTDVVPVGRIKWVENSKGVGKEDCSWYRFSADSNGQTIIHPKC